MEGIPGLYFALACDDRARFVRPDPDNGLHTVARVDHATLRGRKVNSIDASNEAVANGVRFARLLAEHINEDFAEDRFTHLVVVAPPSLLIVLTAMLEEATLAALLGTLAKDLMEVPDLELWPHLLPWLQPASVSRAWPVASPEW